MAKADKGHVAVLTGSASHLLHRVLQLALDIYTEETGKGALTQRQYAVLAAAATVDGASQTDLVKMTGIDRSTLADMVARMIEKGWLGRERSKSDARAKTVSVTEMGRSTLRDITPKVRSADERILANLTASRREAFVSALSILADGDEDDGAAAADAKKKKKKAEKLEKAAKPLKAAKSKLGKLPKDGKQKKKKAKKLQAVATA